MTRIASAAELQNPTAPTSAAPVATINGQVISYAALQSRIQDKLDEQQELHDAQVQQLNTAFMRNRHSTMQAEAGKFVDDQVLALEAASRKTTPAALLASVKTAPVTDAQVEAFYNDRAGRIGQPLTTASPKIKEFLQVQAADKAKRNYLDSLRVKYKAAVTMEPLREQVAADGPSRGPENAPVTIVEFSDFQCPFCGQFEPQLKKILDAYPKQVRFIYRNMPLPSVHPKAQKAAEAAICADRQAKFWEMHDTLFSEQAALDVPELKEKAKRLGLDTARFNDCLDKGESVPALNVDLHEAQRLGLDSTPITFINGRMVSGAVSYDDLNALIIEEIQKQSSSARSETASINQKP